MASQELPPLPMTNSWWPDDRAAASREQTCSSTPAFASKNFSFISALSRHLRSTDSRNCAEVNGAAVHAARLDCDQVAAVVVVRGAGAFGGHHGGAQRRLRRAFRPEGGALVRLLQSLEHLPADAHLGLARADVLHLEDALGIEVAELVAQLVTALGNDADAAPTPVGNGEHARDHLLRRHVAFARHGARVLILHFGAALLELAHGEQRAFEQVERLEAGDDDGHLVPRGDRLVFAPSHDGADVARPEESLHAVVSGDCRMPVMEGGTITCDTSSEKLRRPCALA